jgi:hypothetical protein
VTRLGEFSPIGRLLTLDSCLKFRDVAKLSGLLLSAVKGMC